MLPAGSPITGLLFVELSIMRSAEPGASTFQDEEED